MCRISYPVLSNVINPINENITLKNRKHKILEVERILIELMKLGYVSNTRDVLVRVGRGRLRKIYQIDDVLKRGPVKSTRNRGGCMIVLE